MKSLSKIALSGMAVCILGNLAIAEPSKNAEHKCASKSSCKGVKAKEISCESTQSCKGSASCKTPASKESVMDSTKMSSSSAGCNSKMGCGPASVK